MRTAGQGQAAVPGERVRRRREDGLPGRSDLGRGRTSPGLSREWSAIQTSRRGLGASGFAVERALRTTVLFCAKGGLVWGPKQMRRKYL